MRFTMCMTNKVCVRISDEEKRQLQKYGKLSETLGEAIKLYLNMKKYGELLKKMADVQSKKPIKASTEEIVRSIQEDRNR